VGKISVYMINCNGSLERRRKDGNKKYKIEGIEWNS